MTMCFILTTWRRNAMNIDMVEIMTPSRPMYSCCIFGGVLSEYGIICNWVIYIRQKYFSIRGLSLGFYETNSHDYRVQTLVSSSRRAFVSSSWAWSCDLAFDSAALLASSSWTCRCSSKFSCVSRALRLLKSWLWRVSSSSWALYRLNWSSSPSTFDSAWVFAYQNTKLNFYVLLRQTAAQCIRLLRNWTRALMVRKSVSLICRKITLELFLLYVKVKIFYIFSTEAHVSHFKIAHEKHVFLVGPLQPKTYSVAKTNGAHWKRPNLGFVGGLKCSRYAVDLNHQLLFVFVRSTWNIAYINRSSDVSVQWHGTQ